MRNLLEKQKAMYMEDFLEKYKEELKHKRALYVVVPNLEKDEATKFGIAGTSSGNAFRRLNEYRILYGEKDRQNPCKGVKIYYCGITEYNRLVELTHTQVYKIEKKLKDKFNAETLEGRGVERVTSKPKVIIAEIERLKMRTTRNTNNEDVETNIIKNTRQSTQRYRKDRRGEIDKKIVDISTDEEDNNETNTIVIRRSTRNRNRNNN